MDAPFSVLPFSADGFLQLIVSSSACGDPAKLKNKGHISYLTEYLGRIGTRTIVVENDYIDRHFLEDFAGYYVRCFQEYNRHCKRLHFFRFDFDETLIDSAIRAQEPDQIDKLTASYLGFIVLKPLPSTIIGRTCLRTYPDDNRSRSFPVCQSYSANLFGLPLSVVSLPFQEQDRDVAACATSSLWSALHATAETFGHSIPSPLEITKSAESAAPLESRMLPNRGLNTLQMAAAIRSVGLEPLVLKADDPGAVKSAAYAYLRARIPVLLNATILDIKANRKIGRHAMVLSGFSTQGGAPGPLLGQDSPIFQAQAISRLYAHDDQVGPFARLRFDEKGITTSWPDQAGARGNIVAKPELLLIPLYHKIRIPLDHIETEITRLDHFLKRVAQEAKKTKTILPGPFVWDVFLTTLSDYRAAVARQPDLEPDLRFRLLTASLPRFLWRAIGSIEGRAGIEVLFDATDLSQGHCFAQATAFDETWRKTLIRLGGSFPAVRSDGIARLLRDIARTQG